MTEKQLLALGFENTKSYTHDEWQTKQFRKGVITIDLTFLIKNNKLDCTYLNIDETFYSDSTKQFFSIKEIEHIDKLLNKHDPKN